MSGRVNIDSRAGWQRHWDALLLGLFAYVNAEYFQTEKPSLDPLALSFFAAGAILWMHDTTWGVISKHYDTKVTRNADLWMRIFYIGFAWTLIMMICFWATVEKTPALMAVYGAVGFAFGLVMLRIDGTKARQPEYLDLTKPMTERSGGWIYYAWPLLIIAGAVAGGFLLQHDIIGSEYFLLLLILSGGAMPLYAPKGGVLSRGYLSRHIGLILLVVGVVTA